ncbi:uncharacterized protein TRAVEDRAFT_21251 [Trametes versicolor FP-101664 SS1]|uniref:uncharacterized protein n=1 Tax=Trametes versicolor (strain FP-101664) TaxID=717944 RepID=UPI0004623CBD|nr:uncharacterized protein TRAVEDRAFT_21251 [Trametes versicolor FP-101664 SS1]EIW57717.1 hypothetical protein TRAVEDRAFT_21251 [Trametes versicolor FP-101664 SS1]
MNNASRPVTQGRTQKAGAYSQVNGTKTEAGGSQPAMKRQRVEGGLEGTKATPQGTQPSQKRVAEPPFVTFGSVHQIPLLSALPLAVFGGAPTVHQSDAVLKLLRLALEADREVQVKLLCLLDEVVPETNMNANLAKDDLIRDNPDAPDLFAYRPLHVDKRIITSLKNGFHIPLTMFTIQSMAAVNRHPWELAWEERCDGALNEVPCIDATPYYPREDAMLPVDWREAYPYFLQALHAFLSRVEVARFRTHYEYLAGQRDFVRNFEAVLAFDISVRERYFRDKAWVAFEAGSAEYEQAYHNETMKLLREDLRRAEESQERWNDQQRGGRSRNDGYRGGGGRWNGRG